MAKLGELLALVEKRERSGTYKFTVKKGDAEGEGKLRDFRRLTKLHNVAHKAFGATGDKLDVHARDRLGKNNPNASKQKRRSYAGPQMVKRGDGERADVYLHKRGEPWK